MCSIFKKQRLQGYQKLDQGTLGMSDPPQVNLHQGHQGHQATRVIRANKNNEKLIKPLENDENNEKYEK